MIHGSSAVPIPSPESKLSVQNEILRQGVERLLSQVLGVEADLYVRDHKELVDENGRRLVVRNGYLPPRVIRTGAGRVRVRQPRIHDHRVDAVGRRIRFSSRFLPSYARTTDHIQKPEAALYFQGMATGDLTAALRTMLGPVAEVLTGEMLARLHEVWDGDLRERTRRDLRARRYRYYWCDEIEIREPVEGHRLCVLVVIGATDDGEKELVTARLGLGQNEGSWLDVLGDLQSRSLVLEPERMADAGTQAFWNALRKIHARSSATLRPRPNGI